MVDTLLNGSGTGRDAAASDPLKPDHSPFGYNVGINYESWSAGRDGYDIGRDLDQITKYFKLIKTFHAEAVGTPDQANPVIDPTQQQVIDYVVRNKGLELALGTGTHVLAQGGFGTPWQPGLMTDKAYTDKWVDMIITAFGSKHAVEEHLKVILLSNEIDMAGPPPGEALFDAYVTQWIPQAFDNLKASLAEKGLGSIPVSTTIANYGPTNLVSTFTTDYISQHWSPDWNHNSPIVFYNHYTEGQSKTDFNYVLNYLNITASTVGDKVDILVGETGYPSSEGQPNQASVYGQMFAWLDGQYQADGHTTPLFAFSAFDKPGVFGNPKEQSFGIFSDSAGSIPAGLKPGLEQVIPNWTIETTDTATFASHESSRFVAKAGNNFVDGGLGHDVAAFGGASARYEISLDSGRAVVTDTATGFVDVLTNIQQIEFSDRLVDLFATDHTHVGGLYKAFFGREADAEGFEYWATRSSAGTSVESMAAEFYSSDEFAGRREGGSEELVQELYREVLQRAPDETGVAYWTQRLDAGERHDNVVLDFLHSEEFVTNADHLIDNALWTAPLGVASPLPDAADLI